MTGPGFTIEEKLAEYRALASELSSLQWRTAAVLFGATFLMILWFSSALDLALKAGAYTFSVKKLVPVPIVINAICWLLWVLPEYITVLRPWSRGYQAPMDFGDTHLLESIGYTQYRLLRAHRVYRVLAILVAFQFMTIATITAISAFYLGFNYLR